MIYSRGTFTGSWDELLARAKTFKQLMHDYWLHSTERAKPTEETIVEYVSRDPAPQKGNGW